LKESKILDKRYLIKTRSTSSPARAEGKPMLCKRALKWKHIHLSGSIWAVLRTRFLVPCCNG